MCAHVRGCRPAACRDCTGAATARLTLEGSSGRPLALSRALRSRPVTRVTAHDRRTSALGLAQQGRFACLIQFRASSFESCRLRAACHSRFADLIRYVVARERQLAIEAPRSSRTSGHPRFNSAVEGDERSSPSRLAERLVDLLLLHA